jgi:hypothetical protein
MVMAYRPFELRLGIGVSGAPFNENAIIVKRMNRARLRRPVSFALNASPLTRQ